MLTLAPGVRIYVARDPVDMRKSHNGLCGVTRDILRRDPASGHYFIFFNKRRTLVKVLVWEESGFWVHYKRLEVGTFEIPDYLDHAGQCIEVDRWQLELIFSGITVKDIKRRKRFSGYGNQREAYSRRGPASLPQG